MNSTSQKRWFFTLLFTVATIFFLTTPNAYALRLPCTLSDPPDIYIVAYDQNKIVDGFGTAYERRDPTSCKNYKSIFIDKTSEVTQAVSAASKNAKDLSGIYEVTLPSCDYFWQVRTCSQAEFKKLSDTTADITSYKNEWTKRKGIYFISDSFYHLKLLIFSPLFAGLALGVLLLFMIRIRNQMHKKKLK